MFDCCLEWYSMPAELFGSGYRHFYFSKPICSVVGNRPMASVTTYWTLMTARDAELWTTAAPTEATEKHAIPSPTQTPPSQISQRLRLRLWEEWCGTVGFGSKSSSEKLCTALVLTQRTRKHHGSGLDFGSDQNIPAAPRPAPSPH